MHWGQRADQKRPSSEWVTVAQPDLRIVSDEVWDRAHARLDAAILALKGPRPGPLDDGVTVVNVQKGQRVEAGVQVKASW